VTMNEPFFQGHFPGYPIMPGVLVVEAMAQAGAIIMLSRFPTGTRSWRSSPASTGQVPPPGDAGRSVAHRGGRAELPPARWGAWRARHTSTASWPARPRSPAMIVPRAREESGRANRNRFRRGGGVSIHPSAVIAPGRVVPESCTVGPLLHHRAGGGAGRGVHAHLACGLDGRTRIGARNTFIPLRGRRGAAGSEVRRRADRDRDRRRQHHSRVRHHQPRHGGRRRRDALGSVAC
jgi:hypothetical protein